MRKVARQFTQAYHRVYFIPYICRPDLLFGIDSVLKNYYDILGVPPNATKEQIKSAYRKLSMKFHPDKNDGEFYFESMFKNINEANEILIDDNKRANYDFQLKKFSESNRSNRDELLRKEEELRRKQEELFKKEQELKRQQYKEQPSPPPTVSQIESELDWGKVSNFFIMLNVLLLGLIFVTPNKNDRLVESAPKLKDVKLTQPIIKPKKNYNAPRTQIIDTIKEESNLNDTVKLVKQPAKANKQDEEISNAQPLKPHIDSPITKQNVDSLSKKPKWYQFKKLKEWKKKNRGS